MRDFGDRLVDISGCGVVQYCASKTSAWQSVFPPYLPLWPLSILAHVSRSVTVRLKTNAPGCVSGSTQKYPCRSNW